MGDSQGANSRRVTKEGAIEVFEELVVLRSARKGRAWSRLGASDSAGISASAHHATNNPLGVLVQLLRGGREVVWGWGCMPTDDAQASEEFGVGAAEHVGRVSSTEERPIARTTRLILGEPIGPQRSWQLHYPNCDPDNRLIWRVLCPHHHALPKGEVYS